MRGENGNVAGRRDVEPVALDDAHALTGPEGGVEDGFDEVNGEEVVQSYGDDVGGFIFVYVFELSGCGP